MFYIVKKANYEFPLILSQRQMESWGVPPMDEDT